MEKLIHLYMKYQCMCSNLSYEQEIKKIGTMHHNKNYTRMMRINELEDKLKKKNRVGCVYFISDGDYTKIGYTYYLPKRMEVLQISNARKLTLVYSYLTIAPKEDETAMHLKYASSHISGEWYDLKKICMKHLVSSCTT